jgi:hypothetical protein
VIRGLSPAVALFLLLAAALSAQPTQRRVFVTGADGSGTPVVDLRAEDFQVVENGEERKILRAARAAAPMRIALVVDSSNAMVSLLNNLRAGLRTFLDELPGEHEISFITTGGQIRIRQAPTADRQKLKTAVGLLASDGGANSLIETMMETERRFLNSAPGQWPILVIVTTATAATAGEPNLNRVERFISNFIERGGTAHAIVLHPRAGGITTEFVMNVVEHTGGYYESMTIANVLPEKMKNLAAHIDANYKAMANWYELEYIGDGRAQARVQVGVKRPNVILQMSTRRPF